MAVFRKEDRDIARGGAVVVADHRRLDELVGHLLGIRALDRLGGAGRVGATGVDGFLVTTGWGTWGFKAMPAGGEGMAELIATGRPSALIAPFSLDRFRRDHVLADQGSAGTR